MLSGYRLMWMMVLFDLPVLTKKERRAATQFRKFLLDQGFGMCQLSVYMRFCAGKEQAQVYTRRVQGCAAGCGERADRLLHGQAVREHRELRRPAAAAGEQESGAVHAVLRLRAPFFRRAGGCRAVAVC